MGGVPSIVCTDREQSEGILAGVVGIDQSPGAQTKVSKCQTMTHFSSSILVELTRTLEVNISHHIENP